ncbi:MAG: SDR family oxidoreductase [Acidimicrobiales bacterium]|nr:SDR family oxidoreductase [Acidimicrobiales bacterium]
MLDRTSLHQLHDLTDRVAIVTGGSRGLGRAMCHGLAAMGARVVVASRKIDNCHAVVAEIEAAGGEALAVGVHTGDREQLAALVDATVDRFGRIDIVINNAANALSQTVEHLTPDAWDKQIAVNLTGPVFLVHHALPHLKNSPCAAVVNVSTVGAFIYSPGMPAYVGCKAAMLAITRSMAAEFGAYGIRVNALAPGTFDTDMTRSGGDDAVERMGQLSVAGRVADPDEIVPAVLLLVSDAGSYMNGQVVIVDGGYVAH